MSTLETQIHDYFAYVDEEQGAVAIATVRERRIGEDPVRPIQPATPQPHRPRRWLIGIAAALVVLLLVGGVAVLVQLVRDSESSPVATTPPVPRTTAVTPQTTVPTTPTTAPRTTVTAPPTTVVEPRASVVAGDASLTWERVEGVPQDASGPFFKTGSGVGTVVRNGPFSHSLWASSDLRSWVESDLPVPTPFFEASMLSTASGRWLIGAGPTELWFSRSGESGPWREVDLSGLVLTVPEGLISHPRIGRPALIGAVTLLPVEHLVSIDWERIFGVPPGTYPVITIHQENEFTDVLVVTGRSASGSIILGRVVPRETTSGLFLIDESTGDELFFYPRGIEGVDQDMSGNLVNGVSSSSLHAITDAGVRELDLFQVARGDQPAVRAVQVVEYGGQVVAIGLGDGGIEAFISSDGVEWQAHPAPPFYGDVIVDEASGFLYSSPISMFSSHWVSADAITWSMLDVAQAGFLRRLTSGWLFLPVDDEGLLTDVGLFLVGEGQSEIAIDDPTGTVVHSAVAVGDATLLIGPGSAWLGELSFQP